MVRFEREPLGVQKSTADTKSAVILGCGLLAAPWIDSFKLHEERWKPKSLGLGYLLLGPLIVIFILGNLLILVLSWWPANVQQTLATKALTLPSYTGPIIGTSILAAGIVHWVWDIYILPRFGYFFDASEQVVGDNVVEVTYIVS